MGLLIYFLWRFQQTLIICWNAAVLQSTVLCVRGGRQQECGRRLQVWTCSALFRVAQSNISWSGYHHNHVNAFIVKIYRKCIMLVSAIHVNFIFSVFLRTDVWNIYPVFIYYWYLFFIYGEIFIFWWLEQHWRDERALKQAPERGTNVY